MEVGSGPLLGALPARWTAPRRPRTGRFCSRKSQRARTPVRRVGFQILPCMDAEDHWPLVCINAVDAFLKLASARTFCLDCKVLSTTVLCAVKRCWFSVGASPTSDLPRVLAGRLLRCTFRGLLSVYSRYNLHAHQVAFATLTDRLLVPCSISATCDPRKPHSSTNVTLALPQKMGQKTLNRHILY